MNRRWSPMHGAVIRSAPAVTTGAPVPGPDRIPATPAKPPTAAGRVSSRLNVVKKSKGPVMTVLEEFYKVGPGPSSSHTIGPMRITYDFYQRCAKLPKEQLAKADGIKVHLFGSLSATGRGHGTERAALAGVIGKEPATVEPQFLDGLVASPKQSFSVTLSGKTFDVSLEDMGFMIASNEIPADRRVDFDTTVAAMALTAKEMNSRYKETSEGGLAVSLVLC